MFFDIMMRVDELGYMGCFEIVVLVVREMFDMIFMVVKFIGFMWCKFEFE